MSHRVTSAHPRFGLSRLMHLSLLAPLAAFGLAATASHARAQATDGVVSPANVVLFIGNSFTHSKFQPTINYNNQNVAGGVIDENAPPLLPLTNPASPRAEVDFGEPGPYGGIPGIFKKFTDQAGLSYEVHIEAVSATSLIFHNTNAQSVIKRPQWTAVVMQDQSTTPIPTTRGGNPANFDTGVRAIEAAVHDANGGNPAAKVYLYETWARADITYLQTTGAYYGEPIETMARDLHNTYFGELTMASPPNLAGVIPAGDAWIRAIQQGVAVRNPLTDQSKLSLWAVDYFHPSKYGAYLNALVIFGKLTGLNPTSLGSGELAAAALGISPTEAVALQTVAQQELAGSIFPARPAILEPGIRDRRGR